LSLHQGLGRLGDAEVHIHSDKRAWLADARSFCASAASNRFFRAIAIALALIAIAVLSYVAARRSVDFPVYHYAARSMLRGTGPMYGPRSGIGWPQVYRYPPLFLLLFIPFALLPLRLAAFVWALLKFAALGLLARSLFSRLRIQGLGWQFLALLPALPYLAVEFHYGNVQFFIFALVGAALLWVDDRPVLAAGALALAISVKVAPLFFLPYLIARKRTAVAALAVAFTVALTLLPAGYFGWHTNASLLHQWADQEFGLAMTAGEPAIIGFPSQSMHSVLMRFFVSLNYAALTDSNYPRFNFAEFDPRVVEFLWIILAAAGYMGLLALARRRPQSDGPIIDAIAFCALVLLQPFTQVGDLVILFWPIAVAVATLHEDTHLSAWLRAALYAALSVMVLKPLVPDRNLQRLFQVLGVDFAASCLLAAGLIGKYLGKPRPTTNGRRLVKDSIFSLGIESRGASNS